MIGGVSVADSWDALLPDVVAPEAYGNDRSYVRELSGPISFH